MDKIIMDIINCVNRLEYLYKAKAETKDTTLKSIYEDKIEKIFEKQTQLLIKYEDLTEKIIITD